MIDNVFRVNQLGYTVSLPKYAAVLQEGIVTVSDKSGQVVRQIETGSLFPDGR